MCVCDLITPELRTWHMEALDSFFQGRDVQLIKNIPLAHIVTLDSWNGWNRKMVCTVSTRL